MDYFKETSNSFVPYVSIDLMAYFHKIQITKSEEGFNQSIEKLR